MRSLHLALALVPVLACIWDSDTLDDEIRGLPEAEALVVTGRWVRHGKAYYERRVRDLPARIAAHPEDLGAYDDLGVAYERLEDWEKALAVMDRKAEALRLRPDRDHEYRMLANRGTFLAHAGRYDEALPVLEKAVALNPEAHFGRERFQIEAIRYVAAAKKDPAVWTRDNFLTYAGWEIPSRIETNEGVGGGNPSRGPVDVEAARIAVSGMLRFGGPEGAELYRVLGDLFSSRGRGLGDLNLAWWAWHRALDRGHPAREAIGKAIARVEAHWAGVPTRRVPTDAHWIAMKAWTERWIAACAEEEGAVVARGGDASGEPAMREIMAAADRRSGPPPDAFDTSLAARFTFARDGLLVFLLTVAGIAIAGAGAIALLRWGNRKTAAADRTP